MALNNASSAAESGHENRKKWFVIPAGGFLLICFRLINVLLVNSWFVPDETFQSTEVAHHDAFGYGYKTWEWKENIRSPVHPHIFSSYFRLLQVLGIDTTILVVEGPRVISALLFTYADLSVMMLSEKIYGPKPFIHTMILLYSTWFMNYSSPRPLINCLETTLFMIALCLYPWNNESSNNKALYLIVTALGCIIRPTMPILIFPFYMSHLWKSKSKAQLVKNTLKIGFNSLLFLAISAGMGGLGFDWIINFVQFNVLSGRASHYGTHPWYWYFGPGLMVIFPLQFIALWGSLSNWRHHRVLMIPCFFIILIYSLIPHKESRFLLPIFPLLILMSGKTISDYFESVKSTFSKQLGFLFLGLFVVGNWGATFYLGRFHQTGPILAIHHLSKVLQLNLPHFNDQHLLFLMPCHSTPLYSHLHVNVSIEVLTCEPNLHGITNYTDEADIFYQNPRKWIHKRYPDFSVNENRPACILLFDKLHLELEDLFVESQYSVSGSFFNSHFPDERRSSEIYLICRPPFRQLLAL